MPVIIDKNMDENIVAALKRYFPLEKVILSCCLSGISDSTATHPDMQLHFLDPYLAVCAPECTDYYRSELGGFGIRVISGSASPTDTYPGDIAYNAARLGNYVIANIKHTEPKIVEYYSSCPGISLINTRQGYAKCSLCIAGDSIAVTEDEGIYKTLSALGDISLYKTERGGVSLSGYEYGFIGGATGLVGGTLLITGTPEDKGISEFLKSSGIEHLFLSENRPCDCGSIIYGGDAFGNNTDMRPRMRGCRKS